MRPLALLTCLAVVAGCGGAEPQPASSVVLPAASASTSASVAPSVASAPPAAAPTPMRTASPELRKYWPYGDHAKVALYADLGGLLHSDLAKSFVPALITLTKGTLNEAQTRCLQGALAGIREMAFGADDDGMMIVRFDEQAFQPADCLTVSGGRKIEIEGAKEAYALKDGVLAYVPGIFLAGPEKTVKTALGLSSVTSWPARLSLAPDEYLTWTAHVDEDFKGHGALLASGERFRFSLHADMPADIAKSAEKEFQSTKGAGSFPGLDGTDAQLASRLLQSVELSRSGGHIDAAFDLHEPPADQARDLGMVATLAVDGVKKYITASKSAEARNAVGQIARDYAAWWEKEDGKPRSKKKLVSLPPVPRAVPKGAKYQSKPVDWKPWERIKFSMDEPQYYQYEVKAAPNGESADVIARGDLDGNGKTSLFRLAIRVDRSSGSTLVIAPSMEETNPDE